MMNIKRKYLSADKNALSPIITTILLVLLALVLASIVFLWARGFIKEHITKFDSSTNEEKPIIEACSAIILQASVSGNTLSLVNTGNIPIYKLAINIISENGESRIEKTSELNLGQGMSTILTVSGMSGNNVKITPILLGKKEKSKEYIEYTCDIVWDVELE